MGLFETTKKKRLYVDMDGTLAVFNNNIESEEVLYQEGYYRYLPPQMNVIQAAAELNKNPDIEVFILSAVLPSPYALNEKNAWLDDYLPEIDQAHRIFVPCGEDKGEYIGHALGEDDLLLDDYSKNLHAWCPPGRAIKLLNNINGRFGTWKGPTVKHEDRVDVICEKITEQLFGSPELARQSLIRASISNFYEQYGLPANFYKDRGEGVYPLVFAPSDGLFVKVFVNTNENRFEYQVSDNEEDFSHAKVGNLRFSSSLGVLMNLEEASMESMVSHALRVWEISNQIEQRKQQETPAVEAVQEPGGIQSYMAKHKADQKNPPSDKDQGR